MTDKVMIVKNGYYFRPEARGYTTNIKEAGVFDREWAEKYYGDHCQIYDEVCLDNTDPDTVTIKRSELGKAVYLLNKAHDVSIVVSDKYYDNRLIIIEDSQREALKILETALGEKK